MKEQVGLSLGTQILGQLRDAILSGELRAGERLRLNRSEGIRIFEHPLYAKR